MLVENVIKEVTKKGRRHDVAAAELSKLKKIEEYTQSDQNWHVCVVFRQVKYWRCSS
jgi:hypothetical protein